MYKSDLNNYQGFTNEDFKYQRPENVSDSDIIMDDDMLLVPTNMEGDRNREDPDPFRMNVMPISQIYRSHEKLTNKLPLRPFPVPYSFNEPRPLATKMSAPSNQCSHQGIGCSDHISHTLNCPICKEYFESKTRYLYLIIFVLLLIIIGMKTKFFS